MIVKKMKTNQHISVGWQDNVPEEKEEVKKEIEDEACESCTI